MWIITKGLVFDLNPTSSDGWDATAKLLREMPGCECFGAQRNKSNHSPEPNSAVSTCLGVFRHCKICHLIYIYISSVGKPTSDRDP